MKHHVIRISDFGREVIERSRTVPVVVDFWADWCGPCKVLGPVLERLAEGAEGRWVLATLNTEEHPDVAASYGIRSIPAVKLFVDGAVTDEFTGALPEYAVRQWLEKAVPGPSAGEIAEARGRLAAGDMPGAAAVLRRVAGREPDNAEARVLLARAILIDDPKGALLSIGGIAEPRLAEEIETVATVAAMDEKRRRPDDLPPSQVREAYLGGIEKFFARDYEGALTAFISVIRDERWYDDDGSRKACLAIFRLLGEEHEITLRHRREFGSALYI